jgi:uncharacterized membrane protein
MIITAAITAAVAFVAKLFGVTLSASTLIGVAVVVKILLVLLGMFFSARLLRWRDAQKAAAATAESAQAPPPPAPPAPDPGSGTPPA